MEVHVEEADVADVAGFGAVLAAPLINEIDDGVADALDRGDVQLARASRLRIAPGPQGNSAFIGRLGISHAERNGAHAGAVQARKALREAVGLGVDDEVDLALAVQRHGLAAVLCNGLEAHALEQRAHGHRVGCGVFDELEAVGAHGVLPFGGGGLGSVGQGVVHVCLRERGMNVGQFATVSAQPVTIPAFWGAPLVLLAGKLHSRLNGSTGQA